MFALSKPMLKFRQKTGGLIRRLFPGPDQTVALQQKLDLLTIDIRRVQDELIYLRTFAEPFHFRQGTTDKYIYHDVVVRNEYRLPELFSHDDIILDIGCHIGSFAHACLIRGAGRVVTFEANPENWKLAKQNLSRHGERVDLRAFAVWRSDIKVDHLFFSANDDENTGAGSVTNETGLKVPAVAFDEVVRELTASGRRIRLLKLDCEGSEYPIVLTTQLLHLVDEIVGEYHILEKVPANLKLDNQSKQQRYDGQLLKAALEQNGFQVEMIPHPKDKMIGNFFASRRPNKPQSK